MCWGLSSESLQLETFPACFRGLNNYPYYCRGSLLLSQNNGPPNPILIIKAPKLGVREVRSFFSKDAFVESPLIQTGVFTQVLGIRLESPSMGWWNGSHYRKSIKPPTRFCARILRGLSRKEASVVPSKIRLKQLRA